MFNQDQLPMRVALAMFVKPEPERLRFARQLGVEDIILWGNTFRRPSQSDMGTAVNCELSFDELLELRATIEDAGLRLYGIENFPQSFYDKIFWGQKGRDEQLEHYINTIRNMGRAGICNFGYNWIPYGVKRTSYTHRIRGGAMATAYRHDLMRKAPLYFDREYTEEEFWENYSYFIKGVLPVAEESGVIMSVHPNDPPVERLGGVPHLFHDLAGYNRAFAIYPSDHHKVTLCLGNFEEMGGNLFATIAELGRRKKIHYVHFQSVRGAVPEFNEEFIDTGNYDPFEILKMLCDTGFHGVMIPGHVPQIEGDEEWRTQESYRYTPYHHPMGGYRARAYTVGYIKGMLNAIRYTSGNTKNG
jgi:mannonate dehydratase